MAKAIQLFLGRDSYGRHVEVAQRVDGIWFARAQEYKGRYGWGMSKWAIHEEPRFLTQERSMYADDYDLENEYVQLPEGKYISWGFGKLERCDDTSGIRLPKITEAA